MDQVRTRQLVQSKAFLLDSNLDDYTAEQFFQTVNQPKRLATILFIIYAAPQGLKVNEGLPLVRGSRRRLLLSQISERTPR